MTNSTFNLTCADDGSVNEYIYVYVCNLFHLLHDHPYYHVNPEILRLVSDSLPENGCGSPNHTYI